MTNDTSAVPIAIVPKNNASHKSLAYALGFLLIPLWVYTFHAIYSDSGLFWWLGTDYAQYYSHSQALWSDDPGNIYRPESYSANYQQLQSDFIKNRQPTEPTSVPYPPIFAWLFTPFTLPGPLVGFLLWEGINVLGALYLAFRAAQLFSPSARVLVALIVLTSFPLVDTLLVAQPQILLACAVAECFLALRRGQDFVAGLFLSCLLIKPQYGLLFGLFLVWKRQWSAVAGAAVGGIFLIGGSIVVAGWEAFLAYPNAIGEMAVFKGYWEQNMINWRSLVLVAHPGIDSWNGMLLTQIMAGLTIVALMVVSTGRWMRNTSLFAVQFTLVTIATLLVTHHSFEYGAVMLTVPLAAVLSESKVSAWTRFSVLAGLFFSNLYFVLTLDITFTARILTFALLGCFASMLVTAWRYQQEDKDWPDREYSATAN